MQKLATIFLALRRDAVNKFFDVIWPYCTIRRHLLSSDVFYSFTYNEEINVKLLDGEVEL